MTILNETELKSTNTADFPTGVIGGTSAADIRGFHVDLIESLKTYGGVISGAVVDNVEVTDVGSTWTEFDTNTTSENELLRPDFTTGIVAVKQPALYFITIRFNGQWPANEDLHFHVHVNGIENSITPIEFNKEGKGTTDPELVSVTDIPFVIDTAMISAGGTEADVTLFMSSSTGTFSVDQTTVTFGVRYSPLSIRTVG